MTLFLIGFVAATLLWLGLVWIPRRLRPVDALAAFAAERGLVMRGDGVRIPVTIIGEARGRPFTVTWQRHWTGGDLLLLGVDCAAGADGPLPSGEAGGESEVGGAALVTRWVRPAEAILAPAQLGRILDAMAQLAEELEAAHPPGEAEIE